MVLYFQQLAARRPLHKRHLIVDRDTKYSASFR
jgi:hypothetical protein